MNGICYQVRNWNDTYESADSRKLATLRWLALPNNLDNKGFRYLAAEKSRAAGLPAYRLAG